MENQVVDHDRAIPLRTGRRRAFLGVAAAVALAITCSIASTDVAAAGGSSKLSLPQLEPAEAGTLLECASLSEFEFPSTVITGASVVAAGALSNRGEPIGEHCRVTGYMNDRVSPVDGNVYRIGFEMRLPRDWSGRYLYQANGGLDGSVVTATGGVGGGESGLQMGMAVISSDAGHSGALGPTFGLDPQARLDYGYQAVGTLTPMAKALVEAAYGRGPDRSYMTGGSNGGRHTMVGAARYADEYDGFLAIAPGFNLPRAAVAQIWEAQQLNTVATVPGDLASAITPAERQTIADAILSTCDQLDGLVDGMVQAGERCQQVFSLARDVPTCAGDRDGTCLSAAQKQVLTDIHEGARTSAGEPIYSSFPFDPGLTQGGWSFWQFVAPLFLDSGAVGFVFTSPPDAQTGPGYTFSVDVDRIAANIYESSGIYNQSAMEFMTPPDPARLDTLRDRGGKLMVIHGASDGVFSVDDTAAWYEALDGNYRNRAGEFARYYEVAGMGHVSGGPATDRYDALQALVDWVEQGEQPDRITAWVNPGNAEVPADWSSDRSRPLCVYPAIARYQQGDPESATSFKCTGDKPQTNGY
jgi:pimeloyl-ACP methyl ester carboxylesterase